MSILIVSKWQHMTYMSHKQSFTVLTTIFMVNFYCHIEACKTYGWAFLIIFSRIKKGSKCVILLTELIDTRWRISLLTLNKAKEKFMAHNKTQPLYMYLAFQSVHRPLQAPAIYTRLYDGQGLTGPQKVQFQDFGQWSVILYHKLYGYSGYSK